MMIRLLQLARPLVESGFSLDSVSSWSVGTDRGYGRRRQLMPATTIHFPSSMGHLVLVRHRHWLLTSSVVLLATLVK